MFKHYIADTTYEFFSSFFTSTINSKMFIIDPFTCMVRLSILSFKPKGTKISIYDNMIKYNDPTFLQGTIRWSKGDHRNDLHNLYGPIVKALEWYDLRNDKIQNIFSLSSEGLNKLMGSYNRNNTTFHSLEYYKKIIDENLEEDTNISKKGDTVNKIYTDLKNLWNKNEINIINDILEEMKNKNEDEMNSLINAIDAIITIKEKKVKQIIDSNTNALI